MELKRYRITVGGTHFTSSTGVWCLYEDAAAEIARLKADVETERNRHRAWTDYFQTNQLTHAASRLEAAEDDRRRLKERVAELEGEVEFWKAASEAQRRKNCDECVRIAGGRP